MNVVNLENRKFPMTLLINLGNSIPLTVIDKSNTFNNDVNAIYLVNLIGYHRVKITRFEVLRQTGGASQPIVLSLISPVFQQNAGNYRYPVFFFDQNNVAGTNDLGDVGRCTSVSNDVDYIYNFNGTMPLFIADLFPGYIGTQTFFSPVEPARTYMCVLSLEVEKMI
jgi:hypothetical protein